PSVRAIARTPSPCPRSSAISSRSANDRYLPDSGVSWIDGMPPRSRNQRAPTGADAPHAIAAASLDSPSAIFTQNPRSTSRRTGGRPGDRIAGRPVRVAIHPGRLPIQHLRREVLRRPVEFTQYLSIRYTERLAAAGVEPLVGSVGDSYDNALAESVIGLYKTEVGSLRPWRPGSCNRVSGEPGAGQPAPAPELTFIRGSGVPCARPRVDFHPWVGGHLRPPQS